MTSQQLRDSIIVAMQESHRKHANRNSLNLSVLEWIYSSISQYEAFWFVKVAELNLLPKGANLSSSHLKKKINKKYCFSFRAIVSAKLE